jgi:hypothetical protein
LTENILACYNKSIGNNKEQQMKNTIAIETQDGISTAQVDYQVEIGQEVTVMVCADNADLEEQTGIVIEIL